MFIEMIKTITISEEQLTKRFIFKNPEELKKVQAVADKNIEFYKLKG